MRRQLGWARDVDARGLVVMHSRLSKYDICERRS